MVRGVVRGGVIGGVGGVVREGTRRMFNKYYRLRKDVIR